MDARGAEERADTAHWYEAIAPTVVSALVELHIAEDRHDGMMASVGTDCAWVVDTSNERCAERIGTDCPVTVMTLQDGAWRVTAIAPASSVRLSCQNVEFAANWGAVRWRWVTEGGDRTYPDCGVLCAI